VFVVSACVCGLAVVALAFLPNVRAEASLELPFGALRMVRKLVPLILLGAGTSYMIGSFDTIWPLYLTHRGASTLAVGLSFVAFAVPATLLSARAGMLGDRFGTRRVVVAALLATAFFSIVYPLIASVPWLIGLGLVEGALTISGGPSLNAEVSRSAEPGHQARTQGVFQSIQVLVQGVGAVAGGALFGLNPTYAFFAIAAVCLLGASAALRPRGARTQTASEVL
jgi:MFS family permease